ncbi:hypothetical protein D3C80_1655020 [compost metagenome]
MVPVGLNRAVTAIFEGRDVALVVHGVDEGARVVHPHRTQIVTQVQVGFELRQGGADVVGASRTGVVDAVQLVLVEVGQVKGDIQLVAEEVAAPRHVPAVAGREVDARGLQL